MRRRVLCAAGLACWIAAALPASAQDSDPCRIAEAVVDVLTPVELAGDESGLGGTGYVGDESGLGGTGYAGDESGLGGTGYAGDESGLGGTGYAGDESGLGGTGVYGTIRGFGSLCVNGLRVEYEDDVDMFRNGVEAELSDLAVGQVVWLRVRLQDGRYSTNRIAVYSAVVGQIESIDARARSLRVEGRRVVVPELADREVVSGGFASLRVGAVVDVSGLADANGAIVASRIAADASQRRFNGPPLKDLLREARDLRALSLEGYLQDRPAVDRLRVGGVELDVSGIRTRVEGIATGTRVRARLRVAADGSLVVERPRARTPQPARPELAADDGSRQESAPGSIAADTLVGTLDRPEPVDLPDNLSDKVEPVDRIDKVEPVERIDRVEPVDRIDRVEPVERIDRVQKVPRVDVPRGDFKLERLK